VKDSYGKKLDDEQRTITTKLDDQDRSQLLVENQ
jgi:hypothetical protein